MPKSTAESGRRGREKEKKTEEESTTARKKGKKNRSFVSLLSFSISMLPYFSYGFFFPFWVGVFVRISNKNSDALVFQEFLSEMLRLRG